MKKEMVGRHGDVYIFKYEGELPGDLKQRKTNVVLEGESSGHAHMLDCTELCSYEDKDGTIFLVLPEATDFIHKNLNTGVLTGDHNTIVLEPGNYFIGRQREYDIYEKVARDVED